MRELMLGMATLIGLAPAGVTAQDQVLSGNTARCNAVNSPSPGFELEVHTHFALVDGVLARTETGFTTRYRAASITAMPAFPVKSALLNESFVRKGTGPESSFDDIMLRVRFIAAPETKMGNLRARYVLNGAVVHDAPAGLRVDYEPRPGRPADVMLESSLPRATLKGARGKLEVVVMSSLMAAPVFQLSYSLSGFGVTDWQRTKEASAEMNAAGVRSGGLLPSGCL